MTKNKSHLLAFTLAALLAPLSGSAATNWGSTDTTNKKNVGVTYSTSKEITLSDDINLLGQITINDGVTLTIHGNGRSIRNKMDYSNTDNAHSMFYVKPGGTLIMDNVDIDGSCHGNWERGIAGKYHLDDTKMRMGQDVDGSGNPVTEYRALLFGGIYNSGTLTLTNCKLHDINAKMIGSNNKYDDEGKTVENKYFKYRGHGAITISANTPGKSSTESDKPISTTLKGCEIYECVGYYGTAIKTGGCKEGKNVITIENSKFYHNLMRYIKNENNKWGGIIRTEGSSYAVMSLKNVEIYENFATGEGSGLFWNARDLTIDGCDVHHNESLETGGGMRLETTCRFTGGVTKVHHNRAKYWGAGIYFYGYASTHYKDAVVSWTYDINDKLEVYNNECYNPENYFADGAGICFDFTEKTNLGNGSKIVANINGTSIHDNTARGYGGGVYVRYVTPSSGKNYNVTINLNQGNIKNNSAIRGGGMYVKDLSITSTSTGTVTFSGNYAEQNGGGFFLENGNLSLNTVNVTDNKANSHNGGGIYISGAASKATIESGNITGNSAGRSGGGITIDGGSLEMKDGFISNNTAWGWNTDSGDNPVAGGGGVFIRGGTMTMTAGTISENKAEQHNAASGFGGGLFFYNPTSTAETVTFSGGDIKNNTAIIGGGIAARGAINSFITDASIIGNQALNAGGVYLYDKAVLTYSNGLINKNRATGTTKQETAYQKPAIELSGIGGGIFIGNNAELKFNIGSGGGIGIYDNYAELGADDIFANGNGTKLQLPDVTNMDLSGSNAPVTKNTLLWMEDYITNDTKYSEGTNGNTTDPNDRYRDAIADLAKKYYKVDGGQYDNKYMSLALGFQYIYITLQKTGVPSTVRDNFIFDIYKGSTKYLTAILRRDNYNPLTGAWERTIALPDGDWTVKESAWSWAYTPSKPASAQLTQNIRTNWIFTFENAAKINAPLHQEGIKVNRMK